MLPLIMGAGYTLGPLLMGNFIVHFSTFIGWVIIGGIGVFSTLMMYLLKLGQRKNVKENALGEEM